MTKKRKPSDKFTQEIKITPVRKPKPKPRPKGK
jgi:hypothetical protein